MNHITGRAVPQSSRRLAVRWGLLSGSIINLLVHSVDSKAVVPESGIYYSSSYSGRGFVVDYQNGRVSLGVYSYDKQTGEPVFYVGSAELRDDAHEISGGFSVPFDSRGFFPLHYADVELYKPKGGPCLTCMGPPPTVSSTKVGDIRLVFPDTGIMWTVNVRLPGEGGVEAAVTRRFNFGYPAMATIKDQVFPPSFEGEWVFVETDTAKAPRRFKFAAPTRTDDPSGGAIITFDDVLSDSNLRCGVNFRNSHAEFGPLAPGCELRDAAGMPIFAVKLSDIGVDRVQGALGSLPLRQSVDNFEGPYRRANDIIGLRVETTRGSVPGSGQP